MSMPSVIALLPNAPTSTAFNLFLNKNYQVIRDPKEKFHSTIYFSQVNPFFPRPDIEAEIQKRLPITAYNHTLSLFGGKKNKKVLALQYRSPEVEAINSFLIERAVRQILQWPDLGEKEFDILRVYPKRRTDKRHVHFNPHVSLAKNFPASKMESLTTFEEPITFDRFYWKV